MFLLLVFAAAGACHLVAGQQCSIPNEDKIDCGFVGSNQQSCEADGCCWQPVDPNPSNAPWCFKDASFVDPCTEFLWSADGPGFDDATYDIMYTNYLSQLNILGSGAVVAAPDEGTPGGSYYWHWMRDAGLSIKAWLDINENDYSVVQEEVGAYALWVEKVQHKVDPNGIDVRIEPKFSIPDGEPYTGGWCRPQTDGPALRAMALSKWGMILENAGQGDPAHIFDLVKFDLEWVQANWQSEGCDLWEEVRSTDFYFNRMAYVYSLNVAADFADTLGAPEASTYRALAETIKTTAAAHWRSAEGYIYESENRPYDGAVIHSIATFGEFLFPPESPEGASTVAFLAKKFCREYPINQADNEAGVPGVLIGRYPGDQYAGGNPWQLLTAVTAEFFYLGGQATLKKIQQKGNDYVLDPVENKEWLKLLQINTKISALDFAKAQSGAGDAIMNRMWEYVKNDGGRMDEQIDKNTGAQASAESLTWSYANILHAIHTRRQFVKLLNDLKL
ncbi:unnamed protein product [Notodromas monacha]|uniref:glucan 1,4-alpha-glucosidase n=2 Tax=Notodromas monacha TaxID=399045 RepID=A0A7R9BWF7_9CRUS|nr:unnamed protein product [Notodromas monacha]CAG0921493.1 unnamed protein product [Notodromas monacha]